MTFEAYISALLKIRSDISDLHLEEGEAIIALIDEMIDEVDEESMSLNNPVDVLYYLEKSLKRLNLICSNVEAVCH